MSQSYFSTMFGLGSSELRDGAQQLLKGEGEIGSALFSASLVEAGLVMGAGCG